MITCPACKHSELDGTLFCSECGSRLWGEAFTDETATLVPGSMPRTDKIGSLVIPALSPVTGLTIRISGAPEAVSLGGKSEYLLGRADPKHDVLPDLDLGPYGGQQLGVSRKHATLIQMDAGLSIKDLGSINGTMVNGRALGPSEEWPLRDGDEIRLGKLALTIYLVTEPDSPNFRL